MLFLDNFFKSYEISQKFSPIPLKSDWARNFNLYVIPFIDEFEYSGIIEKLEIRENHGVSLISLLLLMGFEKKGMTEFIETHHQRKDMLEALGVRDRRFLPKVTRELLTDFYGAIRKNKNLFSSFQKAGKRLAAHDPVYESNVENLTEWLDLVFGYYKLAPVLKQFLAHMKKKDYNFYKRHVEEAFTLSLSDLEDENFSPGIFRNLVDSLGPLLDSGSEALKAFKQYNKVRKIFRLFAPYRQKKKKAPKEAKKIVIPELLKAQGSVFIIFAALVFHLIVVASIWQQPLNVNTKPAQRSLVWNLYNDSVHRVGPAVDFFAIYHAGQAMNQNLSPYKLKENPKKTPYFFGFRYLPVVGDTLGKWLSEFDPLLAYKIWIAILEVILITFCFLLFLRGTKWWSRCFIITLLLLSTPYFLEVHMGQFTFACLGLVGISLLLPAREDHPLIMAGQITVSSLFFAGGLLLKAIPAAAIPAVLRHKRFWAGIIIGLGMIILLNLPYFIKNPGDWTFFSSSNLSQPTGGMDTGNYGFIYFFKILAESLKLDGILKDWKNFISAFRMALLGITALIVFFSKNNNVKLGVSALMLAHFLSYAHVWEHHMSGVIVMGAILFMALAEDTPSALRNLYLSLAGLALISLVLPSPFSLFDVDKNPAVWNPGKDWPAQVHLLILAPKVLPTLMLYLITLLKLTGAGFMIPWSEKKQVLKSPILEAGK